MVQLLFIAAFLFIAFIAPLKITLGVACSLLLVVGMVTLTARKLSGAPSSLGDAVRAVGLSFLFVVLAGFALFKFADLTGFRHFSGLSLWLVLGLFLLAYVLGFKLSLGLPLVTSLMVALVAAVISTALYWATRGPETSHVFRANPNDPASQLKVDELNYMSQKLFPALAQEMQRMTTQCSPSDADLKIKFRLSAIVARDGRMNSVSVQPQSAYSQCVARYFEQKHWPAPACDCTALPIGFNFGGRDN
ncbi:hypothetical protein [Bradyrhizobium sp.]|uniref:hypothetical protein n=1 Tax=Bradyrhizobium sp. TaxID=376 RepID=UPI002732FB0F|nr:hypothetical protein [Bradyrhizobium sp.]MDP3690575.1 hypothetical protein [Bradyrhizobium sp.]